MSQNPVLITGGCGFVGRNVVRHILRHELNDSVWLVDNLFTGHPPEQWLAKEFTARRVSSRRVDWKAGGVTVTFIQEDVRRFFSDSVSGAARSELPNFGDVIHLASIVGGRALIDGDPLLVATDLAIDADMFQWSRTVNPERILYASSSAAYPVHLQGAAEAVALKESDIGFSEQMGLPDMTYGWSKLTGEYLSRIGAKHYGLHVTCVRPFSGYGEDQEPLYPVPAIAERAARREDPLVIWGSGRQARDFVHIEDCVDVMFRALDKISDGSAINIGSGVLTSFLAVAGIFAELADYNPALSPLLDKPVGVQNRYADITTLKTQFNWSPRVSLGEGFRRVFEAARDRVTRKSHAG